jgi:hypothetical protein
VISGKVAEWRSLLGLQYPYEERLSLMSLFRNNGQYLFCLFGIIDYLISFLVLGIWADAYKELMVRQPSSTSQQVSRCINGASQPISIVENTLTSILVIPK